VNHNISCSCTWGTSSCHIFGSSKAPYSLKVIFNLSGNPIFSHSLHAVTAVLFVFITNVIQSGLMFFRLCPSSGILKNTKNTAFRKPDLFPFPFWGRGRHLLCWVHWNYLTPTTGSGVSSLQRTHHSSYLQPLYPRMETDPVSETLCYLDYQTMDKIQKPSNPECYTSSSESSRTLFLCPVFLFKAIT
jgi:hypothetical protein